MRLKSAYVLLEMDCKCMFATKVAEDDSSAAQQSVVMIHDRCLRINSVRFGAERSDGADRVVGAVVS